MTNNDNQHPRGVRYKAHLQMYRTENLGQEHVPDAVSASYAGYFYFPALWVGSEPIIENGKRPKDYDAVMFRKVLQCGIEACVSQNGIFFFDFIGSSYAETVLIPGYSRVSSSGPCLPTREYERAYRQMIEAERNRLRILNIHQLCVLNAAYSNQGGVLAASRLEPDDVIKFIDPSEIRTKPRNPLRLVHMADLVMNEREEAVQNPPIRFQDEDGNVVKPTRKILSLQTVERSFDLLDQIVGNRDQKCINMLDECCSGAYDERSERYSSSLISFWTVVEQMIEILWDKFLEDQAVERGRLGKLKDSRTYTSSVKIETMRIVGKIREQLYNYIEVGRKARNDWVHQLREPTQTDSHNCKSAVEELFRIVYGLEIKLNSFSHAIQKVAVFISLATIRAH